MRLIRTRLKFGMELHADKEIAIGVFYRLDDIFIGRRAADDKTFFDEKLSVIVIELVTMTMALGHLLFFVALEEFGYFSYLARICAKAKRAALDREGSP